MAKKETLKQFVKNISKFPDLVKLEIIKDWQDYTDESFAESQQKVPILTGQLLRSGSVKEAKITKRGVESNITYTMPYAKRIHDGEGKIELKPKGFKYSHDTKSRQGEFKYLENPIKERSKSAIKKLADSIAKVFINKV